jgi:SAM-dependent methyltransferase
LSDTWDDKADLLSAWRSLDHNEDYWRFLVRDVWRIDRTPVRVADFGCGYGWAGLFLFPMLASGSEYTGLDRSQALLDKGKELFAASGQRATFVQATRPRPRSTTTSSTSRSPTPSRCICRRPRRRWRK